MGIAYQALSYLQPYSRYLERSVLQRKALSVAPNDPQVLDLYARFCFAGGRIEEALDCVSRAFDLDPLNPEVASEHAALLAASGRYEASLEFWDDALARWSEFHSMRLAATLWAGQHRDWPRFERLAAELRAGGEQHPALSDSIGFLRQLRDVDPRYWAGVQERLRASVAESGTVRLDILTYLSAAGFTEQTFELIGAASFNAQSAGGFSLGILFSPLSKDMIQDIRFVALCAQLGLCEFWVTTGQWPDCASEGVLPYDFKTECRRLAAVNA
jgi:tetratricopeptide (TPR) repeat protein